MIALRSRYVLIPLLLSLITFSLLSRRLSWGPLSPPPPPPPEAENKGPVYKPPKEPPPPPLPEYFPLAASAHSSADIPPVPSFNRPPTTHVPEKTRLYIGFTRYWPLLQQVVISYIVSGWPPEDIYVVENTGTFDANKRGLLTSQNPFYMNYTRLTQIFNVNVITMPSLQTFAQLQNFYLSEAIHHNLPYYFWGHMDVMLLSHEDRVPYKSLYTLAVEKIRETQEPDYGVDPETKAKKMWAIQFFAYDWLAMVNAEAFQKVGGWDSMISYYGTDCDMHSRLGMHDMISPIADGADVWDVSESVEDLELLFRRKQKGEGDEEKVDDKAKKGGASLERASTDGEEKDKRTLDTQQPPSALRDPRENSTAFGPGLQQPGAGGSLLSSSSSLQHSTPEIQAYLSSTTEDTLNSPTYTLLKEKFEAMQQAKRDDPFRNSWQLKQRGGEGEPYYVDADGWEQALQMTVDNGVRINEEKWGHRGCDIKAAPRGWRDAWRVEHDF